MKLNANLLLLLLLTIVLATACSEQTLVGKWKLEQIDLMDIPHQTKRFTLDLTQPEKMKTLLYEENLPGIDVKADTINNLDKGEAIDPDKMKAQIDQYVMTALNTGMTLDQDQKFYIISNGLVVPVTEPGWHFGEKLQGTWSRVKDTLVLSIGDGSMGYQWKYRIIQLTDNHLDLQEVFDGFSGKGNELRFVRK